MDLHFAQKLSFLTFLFSHWISIKCHFGLRRAIEIWKLETTLIVTGSAVWINFSCIETFLYQAFKIWDSAQLYKVWLFTTLALVDIFLRNQWSIEIPELHPYCLRHYFSSKRPTLKNESSFQWKKVPHTLTAHDLPVGFFYARLSLLSGASLVMEWSKVGEMHFGVVLLVSIVLVQFKAASARGYLILHFLPWWLGWVKS